MGDPVVLQGQFERHGIYLSASAVRTHGKVLGVSLGSQVIPTVTVAYEAEVTRSTNVILQLHASESAVRDTPIDEIKANKYQASLGLRSRRGNLLYGFAVTENVANYQNTPDIGLSITLAWIAPNKTNYKPAQRAGRTSPGLRPKADALGKKAP